MKNTEGKKSRATISLSNYCRKDFVGKRLKVRHPSRYMRLQVICTTVRNYLTVNMLVYSCVVSREGGDIAAKKGARILWALEGRFLLVSGFSRQSERQVMLYDTRDHRHGISLAHHSPPPPPLLGTKVKLLK